MTLREVQAQQIKYNSYQYIFIHCMLWNPQIHYYCFLGCLLNVNHKSCIVATSNVVTSVTEQEMRVTLDQAVKCVKEEYLLPEQYGLIPRPT